MPQNFSMNKAINGFTLEVSIKNNNEFIYNIYVYTKPSQVVKAVKAPMKDFQEEKQPEQLELEVG